MIVPPFWSFHLYIIPGFYLRGKEIARFSQDAAQGLAPRGQKVV
jgi:hypothetical protein